jgi:hypothetical protein
VAKEMEINVQPIFSTPLLAFMVPDHATINQTLRRAVLDREASTPATPDYEVVGWSSPHDLSMLDWAGAELKVTEYSDRVPGQAGNRPEWQVAEVWANVQRKGGSNAAHPHPGSFWSGVYYVDVGEISDDGKQGGALQLFDPRGCLPRMLAPYLRYAMPELHDAGKNISLTPTTGQCVLFPGWLYHAVGVYTGDKPRISVAFNLEPILRK